MVKNLGFFNPLVATIFCTILETVTRILGCKEASQVNSSKAFNVLIGFNFFFFKYTYQYNLNSSSLHVPWISSTCFDLKELNSSCFLLTVVFYGVSNVSSKHWHVSLEHFSLHCFGCFCLLITQDGYNSLKCHCLLSQIHYIFNTLFFVVVISLWFLVICIYFWH